MNKQNTLFILFSIRIYYGTRPGDPNSLANSIYMIKKGQGVHVGSEFETFSNYVFRAILNGEKLYEF